MLPGVNDYSLVKLLMATNVFRHGYASSPHSRELATVSIWTGERNQGDQCGFEIRNVHAVANTESNYSFNAVT